MKIFEICAPFWARPFREMSPIFSRSEQYRHTARRDNPLSTASL
ncbi:transcriptional regulator [Acetobacter orientalis]|uniref:Transcriptional regulator n=1 Tax=Acetobacter orientalis TaxID=146474 RepID=A0A2Z5ZLG3_9PROT|nr:transcriptional regulator [Acetobacter orientalis]